MSKHNIKLIAFDLDGTLLDSVPDLAIAADQAAQSLGFPAVSEDQVRDYVGNGADILIARALSQSLSINPDLSDEIKNEARTRFDRFYEATGHQLSHLYTNVKETLDTLHRAGFILALVTNKPSKFVPHVLAQHGIDHYFSDVIGGDTFTNKKPDPMALLWLVEKHGITAKQMMMVGDSKNDILAAKNAGCLSFGLTYGYNHGEPIANTQPDFVADDIADLVKVILI
jgi:phosphoglycolate phosphatase